MTGNALRWATRASIVVAWFAIASIQTVCAQTQTKDFNVPTQDATTGIPEFARQAGIQILVSEPLVRGKRVAAVTGPHSVGEALTILLKGTGLIASSKDGATYTLALVSTGSSISGNASSPDFRVAHVDQGRSPSDSSARNRPEEEQVTNRSPGLTEIVVTAQKRNERIQDVPVPVTAINAATLVDSDRLRLQDYYASIPGLSVTPNVASNQSLSIRGITTGGGTNPTVGVEVDDVPYGASTNLGGGLVVPDIDPGDLARVEVLRGPQGTLYGASSMGGLLKFVTVDPSTEEVSGRVQAGVSGVHNGAQVGYNARGSVNVPLGDSLALRASAFTREDPGYIDNPVLHIDGLNKARVSGGRLSALWRPSDIVSLKVSALVQESKGNGSSDVDVPTAGFPSTTGLGDLQQNYVRDVGGYDRKTQAYSATLNAKLGGVLLTSLTGYNVNQYHDSWDYSYAYGGFTDLLFGAKGAPVFNDNKTDKFTQELRLSAPIGERFEWLLGGFFTHETSQYVENVLAQDPATGRTVIDALTISFPTSYKEYAGFTDLTFHVTDRFDIQIGGRESEISQTFTQTETGPLTFSPTPIVIPEVETKANAFTYLLTPRFKVSPDLMVYGRLASGYRAGGPNGSPGGVVPAKYNPDKTKNYELGAKADLLDHTLSLDASLYYIDWKDIQIQLVNPLTGLGYNTNGSKAKSEGIELSAESRPLSGLTIATWVVWNDAKLTEGFPAGSSAFGMSGDRLPYSSRFSANLSLEQAFPVTGSVTGFAGGAISYAGDREGVFGTPKAPERQEFGGYAKADLRAGVRYDTWTANFFVNNVADKRGALTGGVGYTPPFAFVYIQPRTFGASIVKTF